MALIETKQDLYAAIAQTLAHVVPVDVQREQAQAQIVALIETFLDDLVQGICDGIVAIAEEDIQSRRGRS